MSTPNGSLPGSVPLRVPYDSLTLAAVVAELRPLLVGGQIQDIRQPEPNELLLTIRSQGRNLTLLLSADARFARVHLTTERKPNSPTPSAFLIALRRHIESGRILEVRQRDFDRIFELEVQILNEDGTHSVNTLIAELMGKHSNLILINDRRVVLEAAKRISHRINRFRETLPGKPYVSPPAPEGKQDPVVSPTDTLVFLIGLPLDGITTESLARTLQNNIAGMSPFLAQEIAFRTSSTGASTTDSLLHAWQDTVEAVLSGSTSPCLITIASGKGAYPIHLEHAACEQTNGEQSLNHLLDSTYSAQIANSSRFTMFQDLIDQLKREIATLEKRIVDIRRTVQEGGRADSYQQQGELLLAHLWQIEPGSKSALVQDFYSPDQTDRSIILDPKLSPQENAQVYFRRAHKAKAAVAQAATQLPIVQGRLTQVAAALDQCNLHLANSNFTAEEVRDFRRRLITEGLLREERSAPTAQPTGPDFQGHKIRRYTTPEGYEIYCGETATANDFLTTRVASPNDLWLHVRASPGSHVVIRTKGEPEKVPQPVLLRAAMIAALHSNQKHSGLVPVDYTLKKHVRKPRGAAPGSVEVQREKTLHVSPQDDGELR